MNIIEVSHLVKEYKKIKKERGLRGGGKKPLCTEHRNCTGGG